MKQNIFFPYISTDLVLALLIKYHKLSHEIMKAVILVMKYYKISKDIEGFNTLTGAKTK